jgi:phytoene synthase
MSKNYLSIYAKSFNWAGFFLPKEVYEKCSTLYDFCRTLDNIADEDLDLEIKKEKFKKFKDDFKSKNFDNKIIRNIYLLIEEKNISINIIYDLFDGIESDLRYELKINSFQELLVYSYRVAGTVGLMMAKILNVKTYNSLKGAIDLGIAMQLTNIARDVVEDSKKNRQYIGSDFNTIKNTIKIADLFYDSSFKSIKEIPLSCRLSILVARRVYREIGNKILKKKNIKNYKDSGKIYVSNIEKISQTILASFDLLTLIFVRSNKHIRKNEHDIISQEIDLNERI